MTIIYIAAIAKNRAMGHNGKLPWHIPGDLEDFKHLTNGNVCIMGRGTWEGGIPKPLPGRDNWVVTSRPIEGVQPNRIFNDIESAIAASEGFKETKVFVIGGATLFEQCLPYVTEMYLTHVDLEPEADCWFPEVDFSDWKATVRADVKWTVNYKMVHYTK